MTQGLLMLNRYEIVETLSSSDSSDVVLAFDKRMEREVAIKRLPNNPHTAPRALREARTLARLNHPNIVTVFDFVEEPDFFYIVMEIVRGVNLAHVLPDAPLPIPIALGIAIQLCQALEYAHANNVIHRDVKPANVVLQKSGRVKLIDYGIARLRRHAPVTSDGSIVGTLGYIAPEQVEGGVITEATDLFLLATMIYRMLTGREPFLAETAGATIYKVLNIDPVHPSELNPEVPRALGDAIMRAMEKYSDDRYETVTEFRYKLERFVQGGNHEESARALLTGEPVGTPAAMGNRASSPAGGSVKERISGMIGGLWHGGVGKADAPVSAVLAFVLVFASMSKLLGVGSIPVAAAALAAGATYFYPRLGAISVVLVLLMSAATSQWWLLLLGLPAAIVYLLVWRREEGYAALLPFTAPLIANVGATTGLGLGLLFPFIAGYTLAPMQAGISALLGGFFLEGYDLLYQDHLRFLDVPGPQLGGDKPILLNGTETQPGLAGFFIQLSSPYATNPLLLLQPFLLGFVAFVISSFRTRAFRIQALVAATGVLFLVFGFAFFLTFSPDQGTAFVKLVRQVIAIVPALVVVLAGRAAFAALRRRWRPGKTDGTSAGAYAGAGIPEDPDIVVSRGCSVLSLLSDLEKRIEKIVEGFFSRAPARVEPMDLARFLRKEMREGRRSGLNRNYVPNRYAIGLSKSDYEYLSSLGGAIMSELENYLVQEARSQDFEFVGPLKIELTEGSALKQGEVDIVADVKEDGGPAADGAGAPSAAAAAAPVTQIIAAAPRVSHRSSQDSGWTLVKRGEPSDVHPLPQWGVMVGRSNYAEVQIESLDVSRQHAQINFEKDEIVLEDLDSTNGTFVNGRRVRDLAKLHENDEVSFGNQPYLIRRASS